MRKSVLSLLAFVFSSLGSVHGQAPSDASRTEPVASDIATTGKLNSVFYVDGVKYANLNAAVASANDAGAGSTVDARGVIIPFTISSTIVVTAPMNIWLPCTTMTFTTQILAIESDDVHIHSCGGGITGQVDQGVVASAASQFVASSLEPGTNAIVVQKPAGSPVCFAFQKKRCRTDLATSRISGFTLEPLYIDMNGSGNRALYTTSCWHCSIDHLIVNHANCLDGAVYMEGDLATPNNGAENYHLNLSFPVVHISAGNTTCHPYVFDASNGEISNAVVTNLTADGAQDPIGSGADSLYINTGSKANQSFDNSLFINAYVHNSVKGTYGIKMQAGGNAVSAAGGRIFNVTFIGAHAERLSGESASGIGIGCVNGSGAADGTGCSQLTFIGSGSGNYAIDVDYANLGSNATVINDQSNFFSIPAIRLTGIQVGANAQGFRSDSTLTATEGKQILSSLVVVPSVNKGAFNELVVAPNNFDCNSGSISGSGTIATYSCVNIGGDPQAGTTNYALNLNGGTVNAGKAIFGGGTAVNKYQLLTANIKPRKVAANTCAEQTFKSRAFSALITADNIYVNFAGTDPTLTTVKAYRVTAAGTVGITYCNFTPATLTPVALTIRITAWR